MTDIVSAKSEPRRKPWRIESVSRRMSDEYSDILEAEYLHDDRVAKRYHQDDCRDPNEIRHCYDESQAVEVLAVEPGWIHGEQFYMLKAPGFEDEECYVQDFGFGPYRKKFTDFLFWRSIVEHECERPKNLSDLLSPDFFLPGHKKPAKEVEIQ
jgi:hypothetical protein